MDVMLHITLCLYVASCVFYAARVRKELQSILIECFGTMKPRRWPERSESPCIRLLLNIALGASDAEKTEMKTDWRSSQERRCAGRGDGASMYHPSAFWGLFYSV